MLHELGDDRFGLQVVLAVVVVGLIAHRAVEALDDAVGFRMPRPRLDIDQTMRLDDRSHVAIDELTTMIVNDPRFGVRVYFQRRLQLGRYGFAVPAQ